uniref:ATP-dependent DNA helicase n=1 Tax=Octopus bimaculoides TaxID=37653 RepID=A0A0L8IDP5_OCTBM
MAHIKAFEAVDRTLRDIRNCNSMVANDTVLLSRDFQQTLPVVPRGIKVDLLKTGEERLSIDEEQFLTLNPLCISTHSVYVLDEIFPNLLHNYYNTDWSCERASLAAKNVADSVNYPIQFLNSLERSGTAPHCLQLKKGTPIRQLCNLSQPKLCNGTSLIGHNLRNCTEANILTGGGEGDTTFNHRIPVIPSNVSFSF